MDGYDPSSSFGPETAATYDDSPRGDEAATVACLRRLAGAGPVLELAVGTGRIALPLAATGVRVDGVELSAAMVEVLRAKPGGRDLHVVLGDMAHLADADVPGPYRLVHLVFNSVYNLLTQEDQVRCFAGVAPRLAEDGRFLLEAAVPGPGEASPGPDYRLEQQYVAAEHVGTDRVVLDAGRYDPTTQLLRRTRVHVGADGVRLSPIVLRWASPAELDLMARLAGLRLHERWGGWDGEPFTPASRRHVSVYGR